MSNNAYVGRDFVRRKKKKGWPIGYMVVAAIFILFLVLTWDDIPPEPDIRVNSVLVDGSTTLQVFVSAVNMSDDEIQPLVDKAISDWLEAHSYTLGKELTRHRFQYSDGSLETYYALQPK